MQKNTKFIIALVVAVVVLLGIIVALFVNKDSQVSTYGVGTPSGSPIENYIPAIMYGDGYYSEKGIYTTSTLRADGATTLGTATFSGTVKIGTNGTTTSQIIAGTCNPTMYVATLGATSTALLNCAVTGVTPSDVVFASTPYGTATQVSSFGPIFISNAGASTTAGNITLRYTNLSGAATTSFSWATTSVQYWIAR